VLYEDDVDRAVADWLRANLDVVTIELSLGEAHGVDVRAVLDDGTEVRIESKGEGSQRPGTRRYGQPFTNNQHESHFSRALRRALVERGRDYLAGVALPNLPRLRALRAELPNDLGIAWFWVERDRSVETEIPPSWSIANGGRNPLSGTDWGRLLKTEFEQPYWADLTGFIESERRRFAVFPPADLVVRALKLTPCDSTKVVILGQDPYHGPGQAEGLCFSVPDGIAPPPSLVNIHRELQADCGILKPDHGSLERWAQEGVLLLNTTLTVREGVPGSHRGKGWECFTDAVIRVAAAECDPVFLLWGKEAQRKEELITSNTASAGKLVKSSHPSPPAAYRPCLESPAFLGSKPFSTANRFLEREGDGVIDWTLVR
jgi:uracil-DNA glycosylase